MADLKTEKFSLHRIFLRYLLYGLPYFSEIMDAILL